MSERSRLERFLEPRHAAADLDSVEWYNSGKAETPGEDAWCRLFLEIARDQQPATIRRAGFSAFGPPVVVACADYVCEWLTQKTVDVVRSLAVREIEGAMKLAPNERYAALLVTDALASALDNLRP